MAKFKADREDLVREGTAMPIRGRLWIEQNEIVIGFRRDDACSLYWNQDPVFQFDANQQLRRVFYQSTRYKSRDRRLVRLTQLPADEAERASRLRLIEEIISAEKQTEILQRLTDALQQIQQAFSETTPKPSPDILHSVGLPVPDFRTRVLQWINRLPDPIRIADQPAL